MHTCTTGEWHCLNLFGCFWVVTSEHRHWCRFEDEERNSVLLNVCKLYKKTHYISFDKRNFLTQAIFYPISNDFFFPRRKRNCGHALDFEEVFYRGPNSALCHEFVECVKGTLLVSWFSLYTRAEAHYGRVSPVTTCAVTWLRPMSGCRRDHDSQLAVTVPTLFPGLLDRSPLTSPRSQKEIYFHCFLFLMKSNASMS